MTNSYDVDHGLSQCPPGPLEPVEISQHPGDAPATGNTARDQEMYAAGIRTDEDNAKHNAAIRAGSGWLPIGSAPKDGQSILGRGPRQDTVVIAWDEWAQPEARWKAVHLDVNGFECPEIVLRGEPTLWQPMPAPPCPTCNDQGAVGNILTAQPCPDCAAPGVSTVEDAQHTDACPRCGGSGQITVLSDNSPDAHDVDVCCDHCQGTGGAADAAKYLAAALSGEKYRHMQLYGEFKNFHRSLCARFGYCHDEIHFRRDLVSLEEAIAAKVSAPAAGDAQDAARYRWLCDKFGITKLPCAIERIIEGSYVPDGKEAIDAAIDAAIAAQRKGDA
ncbi:hypothetical protein [Achromobacter xylosoxidans]|uniref:hypothetical protein n=1 Tax=Alcaligenes xylosoxydans xylosoxydans TaxID=85698 RepID=UPI00187D16EC|nr:hypothetical protein [Achromobacter xylosoxidans]MCH4575707.1 hypothetical protein [Achromobacter xylosoxidans]